MVGQMGVQDNRAGRVCWTGSALFGWGLSSHYVASDGCLECLKVGRFYQPRNAASCGLDA